MKVSVVIPTYNRGYTITEALASVFSQTFQDFEVIVVDDGSTDDTSDLVRRFGDRRLRYVRRDTRRGVAAARNLALSMSKGSFISFLDSDDIWKPQKIEYEVAFLERHPQVEAVFSDLEKFDGKIFTPSFMRATPVFSKRLADGPYPDGIVLTGREMYLCLLHEVPIKPTALTLRREAVENIGKFDESRPAGSDWEFLIRFARKWRFGYIDRPLAVLRVLEDATHRLHAERDKLMMIGLLRSERERLKHDPEALAAIRWGIADLTKHLAWHYLALGRKRDAARALIRGFWETHYGGLLLRAIAACLPQNVRFRLKQTLRRKGN